MPLDRLPELVRKGHLQALAVTASSYSSGEHVTFFEGDKLAQFDCVIANPPFSLENWGDETWLADRYGRNTIGGVPPKKNADWAWVQHMYSSMEAKSGRIAVVLPQGALTRGGAEGRIRKAFLERNLIECVIGMAPNLFYGTNLAPCVIILKANRGNEKQNNLLVIDAKVFFRRGRNQNTLEQEHISDIYKLYKENKVVAGLTGIASFEEIKANNYNLNISLYVTAIQNQNNLTRPQSLINLNEAKVKLETSRHELTAELENWIANVTK